MTALADTVANIDHHMTDEEVIGYILAGLGPGHGDLFTAITMLSNQNTGTLPNFYSYLIAHEAQAAMIITTTEFATSTNIAIRQQDSNPPWCNFTGNNNYWGQGRGRGKKNRGTRCQVCSIHGHTTLNCRNRFNHAYQVDEYRGGNSTTT